MIYTKENPKLVTYCLDFEGMSTFTGVVKDKNNTIVYYLNCTFHRTDGPAIVYYNGNKYWYLNGKLYGYDDDYTNESWIRFVQLELLK